MLPVLEVLPAGDITKDLQNIMEVFPHEVIQVADYFKNVYIG